MRDGVIGYIDSNSAEDLDKRISLTGYMFTIEGCTISWKATLKTIVVLSTTKTEYMVIIEACKEALWLRVLPSEICNDLQTTIFFCGSQSAIFLTKD